MPMIKVATILGTRPEIIRMAEVIKKLDKYTQNTLIHTGQNYDYNLHGAFFSDLKLRLPDIQLSVKASSVHEQIANIIKQTGDVLQSISPDAVVVLGDTNSALSLINARRMKIPSFHIEAGDRSFDINVPEELNRKLVDHTATINIAYTEHSRRNLLAEGIDASRIYVCGSPIKEVYGKLQGSIEKCTVLQRYQIEEKDYMVASIHREENVDTDANLLAMVESYKMCVNTFGCKLIVSTHPRTRKRLEKMGLINESTDSEILWEEPFGLIDYLKLQIHSKCVISDSGTIHEDSAVLDFPAVAIRKSTEKYESLDSGYCPICGLDPLSVVETVRMVIDTQHESKRDIPREYSYPDVSKVIASLVVSQAKQLKTTWR